MNDDLEDLIERHEKELRVDVASISWYGFVLSFNPPAPSIATPVPITLNGTTVGILKTYDPKTGAGDAIMDGQLCVAQVMQCRVAGHSFTEVDTAPTLFYKLRHGGHKNEKAEIDL
jgi:hypothetical protein